MNAVQKKLGEILYLYLDMGSLRYEEEGLSHLRHAEQTAYLAKQANASDEMVVSCLLHDIGHLLDPMHNQFHHEGIDREHETIGAGYLRRILPKEVCEPVRLHVQAKRYLFTTDEEYSQRFFEDARATLKVQGGKMSRQELHDFKMNIYWKEAVQLRKWDDEASSYFNFTIPPITSYRPQLEKLWL